jgi:hypothetical protein
VHGADDYTKVQVMKQRELDQKQEKKVGLFDFVNDLSSDKQYLYNDDTDSVYSQFMINRAMSQHLDTILLASEMNKRSGMSNEMHHDFLFYTVDKKKRFGKWAKKSEVNVEVIGWLKNHYCVGHERAIEYLKLLSDEQVKQIELKLKATGGKK